MAEKIAKTCLYASILFLLTVGVIAAATQNGLVLAQPCEAQIGYPNISTLQYYGANFELSLPVSATCSYSQGQLYAVGTAYDTTYNSNIGTANTFLSPSYGYGAYTGQLMFTLPTSAESHSVQFSVSIYSTQNNGYGGYGGYGYLLTTTSSTFLISPGYQSSYPGYPGYPTPGYPSYPAPGYPGGYYNYPGYNWWWYYHNGYHNHYCTPWHCWPHH